MRNSLAHFVYYEPSSLVLPFTQRYFETELAANYRGKMVSGAQPKLTMPLEVGKVAGDCLVKPSTRILPFLAENEFATMQIMASLGFEVPKHWLAEFAPDKHKPLLRALVIRRFDRDDNGLPIHQEQLDAAMNALDKYGEEQGSNASVISYEQIFYFLAVHIQDTQGLALELFRRVLFAYLLGNSDLHLRNFALIYSRNEPPRLAPVYDYVAVCAYPFIMQQKMALPLRRFEEGGNDTCSGFAQYGFYTGGDFVGFAQSIGIDKSTAQSLIAEAIDKVPFILTQYRDSLISHEQKGWVEEWITVVAEHLKITSKP